MKPTETQVGGSHYKDMPIQPATFILRNGIGFHEGSAIKYLCRWRKKGGIEDLKKARHFIDMLIEDAEAAAACKAADDKMMDWVEANYEPPGEAEPAPKRKAIWHNPDNLESAGEGYRFLIQGVEPRQDATHYRTFHSDWINFNQGNAPHVTELLSVATYRTNKPLPEGWEA